MKKLTIITGASSGIGKDLAHNFAEKKMNILAIARSSTELKELHETYPEHVDFIQADITDPSLLDRISEYVSSNNYKITHLIHSAAIIEPIKPIQQITKEEWDKMQDVNTTSPLFLTMGLKKLYADKIRVLFIGSSWGDYAAKFVAPYCVSKAALTMVYNCLKLEMPEINFGIVNPGNVDTKIQNLLKDSEHFNVSDTIKLKSPKQIAEYVSWILLSTNDEDFSAEEWNLSSNLSGENHGDDEEEELFEDSDDDDIDGGRLYH